MQRLQYLDQMKGIAILLVVVGHVMQFSFGIHSSSVNGMLEIFNMPLFFYVSGYLAYKSITGLRPVLNRIIHKGKALVLPLLTVGSLHAIFVHEDVAHWMLRGFGGYWFLYVLLITSVAFILIESVASRIKHPILYAAAFVIPYIGLMGLKLSHIEMGGVIPVNQLVSFYRYFLIGWMCKKYQPFNKLLFGNPTAYALALVAFFLQWYWSDRSNMLLVFLGGLGAIIVLQQWLQSTGDNKVLNLFSCLGQKSLIIYVIHYFFIPNVSQQLNSFLTITSLPFIWQFFFAVALSSIIIAASLFVGSLIEKNKYLSFVALGR